MKTLKYAPRLSVITLALVSSLAYAQVDLTTDISPSKYVIPAMVTPLQSTWGAGDASLIFRALTMVSNGWFDAIAPYSPTAVGIYSQIGRRPADESANNYNKNVAIMYASYRVLNSVLPAHNATWRKMLTDVGLDPNNTASDMTTAIGIGNGVGKAVVDARVLDGMNQLGSEGGCKYNCRPYADYTGYAPVNTAYALVDAGRWQPDVSRSDNGIFKVQQFVTPQYGRVKAYSYADVSAFTVPPPTASNPANGAAYKAQLDDVLAKSAALNDLWKMKVEHFDNKYIGFGGAVTNGAAKNRLNLDRYVHYYFLMNLAAFDTGIAVWNEKYKYDTVRPISAADHVYGNSLVTAWGGPGLGTVNDLPGNRWNSFRPTADHPEYPSGSASFCNAFAQANRRFFGSDTMDLSKTYRKGSSKGEPGITPAADVVLNYATWTDWVNDCGVSRVWGGFHFQPSVDVAPLLAVPIADLAYDFVTAHINGINVPPGTTPRPLAAQKRR